jgi:DNA-binding transcriptional ArsR family regulator
VDANYIAPTTSQKIAALGDSMRREIFEMLAANPSAVGDIARRLPVTRSAVSQHLRVLKEAGLVEHQAFGTRNVYHVSLAGVASLRDYFGALWERALNDYKTVAEDLYRKKGKEKN